LRISSITKNAGKACNNRLYRHIRTFEKIIKNYFVIYIKEIVKEEKEQKRSQLFYDDMYEILQKEIDERSNNDLY